MQAKLSKIPKNNCIFVAIVKQKIGTFVEGRMNVHGVIQSMQPLSTIKTARDVRVLRDANAPPEEVLALVRAIRDQVFHFRQTAEALVAKVDRSPRLCAGVLLLIERTHALRPSELRII
jgi:hypothetical protein